MTDRKQRIVVIIGIIAIILSVVFSLAEKNGKKSDINTATGIEELIDAIEGVNEPKVIIYTSEDDICGIAVVYNGDKSFETKSKIYELISSLYGISYSRIYVGN